MRRLYVLIPKVENCKQVVQELETLGIPEHHLHVVASIAQHLEGLPEATVWQKTELAHGIEWGIGLGGIAGLLGGVMAVAFPPPGLILGGGALLAGAAAGAGLGGIVSAMLGSHEHNHTLDRFRAEINRGRILLMVDAPSRQVEEIQTLIRRHHPEAEIKIAEHQASSA
jgi:hypothetical protein